MSGTKEELVRSWLIKARRDLLSAHELATAETSLLDTAAYHCQQASEKVIKGFLVFHNIRFEKSHDIVLLVTQASDIDPEFSNFLDTARLLTPLAVEYRYPGDYLEPELHEYQEASEAAHKLYSFVLSRLPEATHP
ncbi:MAG: HEPN domain-containing protein [Geobacter sp.]|nr:HEPN domain-containing protein [Geobacter sp.]